MKKLFKSIFAFFLAFLVFQLIHNYGLWMAELKWSISDSSLLIPETIVAMLFAFVFYILGEDKD
jgi:hypothetical protein